ncbi:multidrug effflux MFS transporter [Leucobacter weissii]|uniref:Multidrug effflux MFS transporter n=1 Tax=Leucobacter weissii TaxID=1983706 RepID=A0A939MQ71_9MICO|nr:multidrug effflux MFS transporter [Leucobacter weissii]MBO1902692.1 multidrug effflux MFS transporter [Leucobacter weissii]
MTRSDGAAPAETGAAEGTGPRAGRGLTAPILLSVGALAMLGPLSTDVFLPALPTIAEEFATTSERVQFSLTATTVGLAIGQLFSGPLSDAIGRRRPLLVGSAAMTLFSVACAAAPELWLLIAACFLMGLGASTGGTVGRAVVSDVAVGTEITRGFALLGTLMSLGPVIAPVVGVLLMIPWGWRGIFIGLAAVSALIFAALAAFVPESLPPARRVRGGVSAVPRSVSAAARSRAFWCGAISVWAAFAASFSYIAGSSYVLQLGLGFSSAAYAVTFAVNGVGLMAVGLLAARLSRRWNDHALVGFGLVVLSIGAALVAVAGLTGRLSPWLILPGFFCLAAACGLYIGPALSVAVQGLRHIAGTVLALVGAIQFVVAGLVSPISALGGGTDLTAMAALVVGGSAVAWAGWFLLRPRAERLEGAPRR